MNTPTRTPRHFESHPDVGLGLRLRIWIGCLAGALVVATGLWLAVLWASGGVEALDSTLVWVWLPVIATAGILIALAMALWLDHGIVTPLRAHLRALRSGHVAELRGVPSPSGWGEVSALTQELQEYLARHRDTMHAVEALQRVQSDVDASRAMLDKWIATERWEALPEREGALADITRRLNKGMAREQEVHEQNHEASLQIREDLGASIDDARESAEQAERGFVEATALLTTVRELQRLAIDLDRLAIVPDSAIAEPALEGYARLREAASGAIAELVQASSESVGHLSTALLRVREVGDQVQMLGNRATLLALNVMMARGESAAVPDDTSNELRALAREVRVATERAAACTYDVEQEVERSSRRMDAVRARVAETLARIPENIEVAPASPQPDVARLMERVREMVQDATSKGEQLSSAGERASRAAERLVRRLDESVTELDGLAVRLSPIELPQAPPPKTADAPSPSADEPEDAPQTLDDPNLRLLGPRDVQPGSQARPGDRS
jgi:methyl-accepting chemotaxis protein